MATGGVNRPVALGDHRPTRRTVLRGLSAGLGLAMVPSIAPAQVPSGVDDDAVLSALRRLSEGQLRQMARELTLVNALIIQNQRTVSYSTSVIERLDGDWRREVYTPEGRVLVPEVMDTPASYYLQAAVRLSNGLYTELMLIDAQGLNAGLSAITPDYFQGDEDKWRKTYPEGITGLYIGEYEHNSSTDVWQRQVAITVIHPTTLVPIGVLCAGVAIDNLG